MPILRRFPLLWAVLPLLFAASVRADEPAEPVAKEAAQADAKEISLFDGKSLEGWKKTNFGGEGEIEVKEGEIRMDFGSSLTGITYTKEFPKSNYEVEFKAMQVDGIDFFCGTTFPVGDTHCSLIIGGWGGGVLGLSSINGHDASENETTQPIKIEQKKWYDVKIRVTDTKITAWLDGKQVIDQNIVDKTIGIRPEMELSRPFGIAAWETKSAIKDLKVRKLAKED